MLRWRSFYSIVHSISAAIDSSCHHDMNFSEVCQPELDLALWQSLAQ